MEDKCEKCKGTGIIKEKDGTVHTCWKCLEDGKLEQHNKEVRDSGIKV